MSLYNAPVAQLDRALASGAKGLGVQVPPGAGIYLLNKFSYYRKFFPIVKKYAYLNHASTGPANTYSLGKAKVYLDKLLKEGEATWDFLCEISESTREKVASLLKVNSSEIAFVQNTSIGINLIIGSIRWQPGDEVVISKGSFPALTYPFKYNRYGLKVIEADFDSIERVINRKTKLVALEWINYFSGERIDLEKLLRLKKDFNFYLLLDAIQGLGAVPLYPKDFGVDFVVSGTSKWLLGPQGLGILYINQKTFESLNSGFVGWLSSPWKGFSDFSKLPEPYKDTRAFETGTKNYFGLAYLGGNLDMILDLGVEEIFRRISSHLDFLFEKLSEFVEIKTPKSIEQRGGIFTFRLRSRDSEYLFHYLERKGFKVSLRNGYIRVSPHFYNTEDEIHDFVKTVKEVAEWKG